MYNIYLKDVQKITQGPLSDLLSILLTLIGWHWLNNITKVTLTFYFSLAKMCRRKPNIWQIFASFSFAFGDIVLRNASSAPGHIVWQMSFKL